ncbi:MAG: FtsX-like permease family protein [Bacteroidota bacterium]
MTLWKISVKNIKTKPLYTFLSVFILGLSIALLLGIQQLKTSFKYQMENNLGDIDMVVGAKGSPLQLVLSSVLHLDNPTGNIPYAEAKKLSRNPLVKRAVPISYGDNYKGYRIVGATDEFPTIYNAELAEGRTVEKSLEVVLGHTVAEKTQLNIGDTFKSSHGLIDNDIDVHDDEFVVVGIYKPTLKVIDRLIFTNLESIWNVHDHDHDEEGHSEEAHAHDDHEDDEHAHDHEEDKHSHDHEDDEHEHDHAEGEHDHDHEEKGHSHEEHSEDEHAHEHDEEKEITSLLVTFRNPTGLLMMPRRINEETNMQAALPKFELDKLYEYTGVGFKTISLIAYIILVISSIIIFISLYKMVKERSFDLALMRVYGAKNSQLIRIIAYEGFIIVFLAFIVGVVLSKAGLYFMVNSVDSGNSQKILQSIAFHEFFQIGILVFGMIIVAVLLAINPITKMNISTILSNEK